MKTTLPVLLSAFLLLNSCSGDDEALPGPNVTLITEGYLCTGTASTPFYYVATVLTTSTNLPLNQNYIGGSF